MRVRYGDRSHVLLSGTASIDNRGEIVAPEDIAGQTVRMLENVEALLAEGEASADDLAQMIVYLRDATDCPGGAEEYSTTGSDRFPGCSCMLRSAAPPDG